MDGKSCIQAAMRRRKLFLHKPSGAPRVGVTTKKRRRLSLVANAEAHERGLNVPFFHPQIPLRLGRQVPHFNMVERPFHHQSHPIRHSAQGQCNRAAGAVEVVGEVAGDGADGQEVFGGVGHEGFGVSAGGEAEEAGFAFGLGFGARFEVVVEGAFGGFVEFS